MAVVMLEACTHQVMAVITFLVEMMLAAAHIHLCILAGVRVAVAVTWEAVVQDLIIEIQHNKLAAIG